MRRTPRIYIPGNSLRQSERFLLDSNIRHRLANVLRLKKSDELILFNGIDPVEASVKIVHLDRKTAEVEIDKIEKVSRESPLQTCLWQAIEKPDRMDYAIQKAVELGVSCIQPVYTEYSLPPFRQGRLKKKIAHWQGIIIHACEQTGRCILPALKDPLALSALLQKRDRKITGLMPDPDAVKSLRECHIDTGKKIEILIGPIAGFTKDEVMDAEKNGMQSLHLGPRILRTETAGIAILAWLQVEYGDLN